MAKQLQKLELTWLVMGKKARIDIQRLLENLAKSHWTGKKKMSLYLA
ncbi:MAG: hypothetical protein IPN29_17995 [Saprospiraceae bacterium]|nr:hypothetical protein [Saprospiraceae bacterium]